MTLAGMEPNISAEARQQQSLFAPAPTFGTILRDCLKTLLGAKYVPASQTQKRRDGFRVWVIMGGRLQVADDDKIYCNSGYGLRHARFHVTDDNWDEIYPDHRWEYLALKYGTERLEHDLRKALADKGYAAEVKIGRANAHATTVIVKPLAGPVHRPTPLTKPLPDETRPDSAETNAMGKCADCRFFIGGKECRRYAPRGGLGYLAFQFDEVLRDIAWSLRVSAQQADKDDVEAPAAEVNERQMMTRWPQVEPHDWCGEFQPADEDAALQKDLMAEVEAILAGPPPTLPPTETAFQADFDRAVAALTRLKTRSVKEFAGTRFAPADLLAVAEFINHVRSDTTNRSEVK